MSTIFHREQQAKLDAEAFRDAQQYAIKADMDLSRDASDGFWLHYDGHMRYVRFLSDVRGTVDWIEGGAQ